MFRKIIIFTCSVFSIFATSLNKFELKLLKGPPSGWGSVSTLVSCSLSIQQTVQKLTGKLPTNCMKSPDGKYYFITFSDKKYLNSGYAKVMLLSLEPSPKLISIAKPEFRFLWHVIWSSDGTKLALTGVENLASPWEFNKDQVFIYDLKKNKMYQTGNVPGSAFQLSWSPDNNKIIAIVVKNQEDIGDRPHGDAFLIEMKKNRTKRLTSNKNVISPVWKPDGSRFIIAEQGNPSLLFFNKKGDFLQKLSLDSISSDKLPEIQRMEWMLNGTIILYLADFTGTSYENEEWYQLSIH